MQTMRRQERHNASPREGERGQWAEWQVLEGRKIIARFDTRDQAAKAYPGAVNTTPEIELHKSSSIRGRKIVFVDGEPWGHFSLHQHGGRGSSYTLHDTAGVVCRLVPSKIRPGTMRPVELVVKGDNLARHEIERAIPTGPGYHEAVAATMVAIPKLETRLVTAARGAIAEGLFKSPAARRKEREEAAAKADAAEKRRNTEEAAALEARAREALGLAADGPLLEGDAADVAAVVAAMKWAQTR